MSLRRKKITVRSKSGKTFQRSVMVRAEAIGKRAAGKKLNSLNPWEARHTEQVSGTSFVGGHTVYSPSTAKSRGSSGPGSSHSWLAIAIGAAKQQNAWARQQGIPDHADSASALARSRREAGRTAITNVALGTAAHVTHNTKYSTEPIPAGHNRAHTINSIFTGNGWNTAPNTLVSPNRERLLYGSESHRYQTAFNERYGGHNVTHVPQDPRKHVR